MISDVGTCLVWNKSILDTLCLFRIVGRRSKRIVIKHYWRFQPPVASQWWEIYVKRWTYALQVINSTSHWLIIKLLAVASERKIPSEALWFCWCIVVSAFSTVICFFPSGRLLNRAQWCWNVKRGYMHFHCILDYGRWRMVSTCGNEKRNNKCTRTQLHFDEIFEQMIDE